MTYNLILIYGLFLMAFAILLVIAVAYGSGSGGNITNKECFDGIMWGDNSTVGYVQNLTEYCTN